MADFHMNIINTSQAGSLTQFFSFSVKHILHFSINENYENELE